MRKVENPGRPDREDDCVDPGEYHDPRDPYFTLPIWRRDPEPRAPSDLAYKAPA